jgi:hypothetical protein
VKSTDQDSGGPTDLSLYGSEARKEIAMVTCLRVRPELIEGVVDITQQRFSFTDAIVYVTDQADFMPFRRKGVMFEYVPPLADLRRFAPDQPWHLFLKERRDLLMTKWQPFIVLSYGINFDSLITEASGV